MPNLKSAKKRMRQNVKRREENLSVKTRVKSARRKFFEAVEEGRQSDADQCFRTYCSVLDKAAKNNVVSRNTAQRRKSRAQARLTATAKAD